MGNSYFAQNVENELKESNDTKFNIDNLDFDKKLRTINGMIDNIGIGGDIKKIHKNIMITNLIIGKINKKINEIHDELDSNFNEYQKKQIELQLQVSNGDLEYYKSKVREINILNDKFQSSKALFLDKINKIKNELLK